jgi:hypothetical protein
MRAIIEKTVNVDVMIEKMKTEIQFLNNGWEYSDIKNYIVENGSGVYEFCFGCRGGLEDFIKNDEYDNFDSDDYNFINENFDFIKCVSYDEENYSVFVNVVV